MPRRGFVPLIILLIVAGVLIAGGAYYYKTHHANPSPVALSIPSPTTSSNTPSIASSAQSATGCAINFSDFDIPPLPSSTPLATSTGYVWIPITQENTHEFYTLSSEPSASGTEVIYPSAFDAEPSLTSTLPGNEWVSPIGNIAYLDDGYYGPMLQRTGWTHSVRVPLSGGGFQLNSEKNGYIKVENGYFRSIVFSSFLGSPSYRNVILVYESDVVPLSQIIPGFQPACPPSAVNSTANSTINTSWLASIQQKNPKVAVVPNKSSIPEIIRGKVVFLQNGDAWTADQDGGHSSQLTHTNGNVSAKIGDGNLIFAFSPDYHYLAYFVLWPGKSVADQGIDVLNLSTDRVIKQINGNTLDQFSAFKQISQYQTPRVTFEAWTADDQFVYNAWGDDGPGGGTDEYGHLLVDLQKGKTTVIQPQ